MWLALLEELKTIDMATVTEDCHIKSRKKV